MPCARTQSAIAQSPCEVEYIEATAATSEAKYIEALFLACGQNVNIHLRSDSSGAIGVGSRRGLGVVAGGNGQQEHSNQQGAWA